MAAAVRAASSTAGGKRCRERLLEQERKEIVAAVERSQGNIASAARALGINRSTLYYRLRKHGLEHLLPTKDAPASASSEGGVTAGAAVGAWFCQHEPEA